MRYRFLEDRRRRRPVAPQCETLQVSRGGYYGRRRRAPSASRRRREALAADLAEAELLVHTDRGVRYASEHYQRTLARHGLTGSMSRPGNGRDDAPMESFFATPKTELVRHERYPTRAAARQSVFEYVEVFSNRLRRRSAPGYVSPHDFEPAA